MKCPDCGSNYKKGAKFCKKCGYDLSQGGTQPKTRSRLALEIAAVIAIFLIVLSAFVLLGSNSSNTQFYSQKLPDLGTPMYQFSNITISNSTKTTEVITSAVTSALSNTANLTVHYNGYVKASASGSLSALSVFSPILIGEYISGENAATYVNVTSVPIIGNADIELLNISSGDYVCSNINLTDISSHNYISVLSSSRNIQCINSNTFGIDASQLESPSQLLQDQGISINYTSAYQSDYNGMNCTYIAGTVYQQSTNGAGTFSTCISDEYSVPLTVFLQFGSTKGSGAMTLNETSISNSAPASEFVLPSS